MTAPTERSLELTAWVVLLAALAVFLLLLFGVPYALVAYARHATAAETAVVESRAGSVTLESTDGVTQVLGTGQRNAKTPEGITVTTQAGASAFIQLFDNSVVHLRPDTAVGLRRMRHPRFSAGGPVRHLQLTAAPANGQPGSLTVGSSFGDVVTEVVAPQGRVWLEPESQARLEVTRDRLKVVAGEGAVTVDARGQSVRLAQGQRTEVVTGGTPAPPMAALEDVVRDTDFDQALGPPGPWSLVYDPPLDVARLPGEASQARTEDGRTVVRFVRRGSLGSPGDMYAEQGLAADVTEAEYLGVTADLRVLFQDLPGGGTRLTEFPVIVTLIATDGEGDYFEWRAGFYAKPPDPADPNSPVPGAPHQQVTEGEWYRFDTGNLLDPDNPNGFARLGLDRPARLTRVLVKASGHDYVSEVDSVGVWVK